MNEFPKLSKACVETLAATIEQDVERYHDSIRQVFAEQPELLGTMLDMCHVLLENGSTVIFMDGFSIAYLLLRAQFEADQLKELMPFDDEQGRSQNPASDAGKIEEF